MLGRAMGASAWVEGPRNSTESGSQPLAVAIPRPQQEALRRRMRRLDPSGALWPLPTHDGQRPADACERPRGDEQRARSAAVAIGVAVVALDSCGAAVRSYE